MRPEKSETAEDNEKKKNVRILGFVIVAFKNRLNAVVDSQNDIFKIRVCFLNLFIYDAIHCLLMLSGDIARNGNCT